MKKGDKYLTHTDAVCQNNQQSLDNRIVIVDKVNSEHEIICRVDFDNNESIYLPFDATELVELNLIIKSLPTDAEIKKAREKWVQDFVLTKEFDKLNAQGGLMFKSFTEAVKWTIKWLVNNNS